MMKIVIVAILFCFAAFTVAQTTNGLQCNAQLYSCEACLNSTGAQAGDCGWCDVDLRSRSDVCTTPDTCRAYNGTYITNVADCTTCTSQPNYAPKRCLFGTNRTFITASFASCQSANDPQPSNGTSSSSATSSTCTASTKCLTAVLAFGCSMSCAFCDPNNYGQSGRFGKVCQSVQTLINNESCAQEIASGCNGQVAYPDSLFSNNTAECRPLINADLNAGTSSSGGSQASSATASASSQASSATASASSQASSATASASSQASSVGSSLASSGNGGSSGAATTVVSLALLALVALLL